MDQTILYNSGVFFEKPDLDVGRDAILVFSTLHNEEKRLPFFLRYYKSLGVDHFFLIDNNSTDRTAEIIRDEPSAHYFFTAASYSQSDAGRLWTEELADHYGRNRWCLVLDADELLVFPGIEDISLRDFCAYNDRAGYEAVYGLFLDLYHPGPLSEALYTPGQDFRKVATHFDADSYRLRPAQLFPPIQLRGGPRWRLFWDAGERGSGPAMRKSVLVKRRAGFSYRASTHSMSLCSLSDVTSAVLHFKFFSDFDQVVAREVQRGDRPQAADYARYEEQRQREQRNFGYPGSVAYEDSWQLVRNGFVAASRSYLNFLGERCSRPRRAYFLEALDGYEREVEVDQRYFGRVWQMVHRALAQAGAVSDAFGPLRLTRLVRHVRGPDATANYHRRIGLTPIAAEVLSVRPREILGWACDLAEPARPVALEAVTRKGAVAGRATTGLPLGELALGLVSDETVGFRLPLQEPPREPASLAVRSVRSGGLLNPRWLPANLAIGEDSPGAVTEVRGRRVSGWVRPGVLPRSAVPLEVRLNGRHLMPVLVRPRRSEEPPDAEPDRLPFEFWLPRHVTADRDWSMEVVLSGSERRLTDGPLWLAAGDLGKAEAPFLPSGLEAPVRDRMGEQRSWERLRRNLVCPFFGDLVYCGGRYLGGWIHRAVPPHNGLGVELVRRGEVVARAEVDRRPRELFVHLDGETPCAFLLELPDPLPAEPLMVREAQTGVVIGRVPAAPAALLRDTGVEPEKKEMTAGHLSGTFRLRGGGGEGEGCDELPLVALRGERFFAAATAFPLKRRRWARDRLYGYDFWLPVAICGRPAAGEIAVYVAGTGLRVG